ncbi:MAG: hypothetical protein EBS30_09370 [Planctomycetes bacterium]|nr:hypothetical protein [Planctomycetota bacterium]
MSIKLQHEGLRARKAGWLSVFCLIIDTMQAPRPILLQAVEMYATIRYLLIHAAEKRACQN